MHTTGRQVCVGEGAQSLEMRGHDVLSQHTQASVLNPELSSLASVWFFERGRLSLSFLGGWGTRDQPLPKAL